MRAKTERQIPVFSAVIYPYFWESLEDLITGYISEVKRRNIFRFGIHYPVRNPVTGGHRYYLAHFLGT